MVKKQINNNFRIIIRFWETAYQGEVSVNVGLGEG